MISSLKQKEILANIKLFLAENAKPYLNEMDEDFNILKNIFILFRDQKFFRLYVPLEYGGEPLTRINKIFYEEMMGQCGGALAEVVDLANNLECKESHANYIRCRL